MVSSELSVCHSSSSFDLDKESIIYLFVRPLLFFIRDQQQRSGFRLAYSFSEYEVPL